MNMWWIAIALSAPGVVGVSVTVWRRKRKAAAEREERLRNGGLVMWVLFMREHADLAALRHSQRNKRFKRIAERATNVSESIGKSLPGGGKAVAATGVGACALGGIWVLAFRSEVTVAIEAFQNMGYGGVTPEGLAYLVGLGLSLPGVLTWELLGVTRFVPGVSRIPRSVRWTAAAYCMILFAIAVSQLPRAAVYRSEPIAVEVRAQAQNVRVLEDATDPDPALVSDARARLDASQARLAAARYTDRRLVVVAAVVETVTGAAAIWLVLLVCAGVTRGFGMLSRRLANAAENQVDRIEQTFRFRVTAQAERLSATPEEVEGLLERRSPEE